MQESLPFLLINGGVGLAVIWLMNRVFNFMREHDSNAAKAEETQTATYKDIINSLANSNIELRASMEQREAVYQAHNERMATALSVLNDTQLSQISVLDHIHQSNEKLTGVVGETNTNVLDVRSVLDEVLVHLQASVDTFREALSLHDNSAKERNQLLLNSLSSRDEEMKSFRESMERVETTMQQLRDLVKKTDVVPAKAPVSSPNGESTPDDSQNPVK